MTDFWFVLGMYRYSCCTYCVTLLKSWHWLLSVEDYRVQLIDGMIIWIVPPCPFGRCCHLRHYLHALVSSALTVHQCVRFDATSVGLERGWFCIHDGVTGLFWACTVTLDAHVTWHCKRRGWHWAWSAACWRHLQSENVQAYTSPAAFAAP